MAVVATILTLGSVLLGAVTAHAETSVQVPEKYWNQLSTAIHSVDLPDGSRVFSDRERHMVYRDWGNRRQGIVVGDGSLKSGSHLTLDNPTQTGLHKPEGVAVAGNTAYVADAFNHRVLAVDLYASKVDVFAGVTGVRAHEPIREKMLATEVRLDTPSGVAVRPNGNVLIGDRFNYRVLEVDPKTGITSCFAGTGRNCQPTPGREHIDVALGLISGIVVDNTGAAVISEIGTRRVSKLVDGKLVELKRYAEEDTPGAPRYLPVALGLLTDGSVVIRENELTSSLTGAKRVRYTLLMPDGDALSQTLAEIKSRAESAILEGNNEGYRFAIKDLKLESPPREKRRQLLGQWLRVSMLKGELKETRRKKFGLDRHRKRDENNQNKKVQPSPKDDARLGYVLPYEVNQTARRALSSSIEMEIDTPSPAPRIDAWGLAIENAQTDGILPLLGESASVLTEVISPANRLAQSLSNTIKSSAAE
jgi:hypothetical protein